MGVRNSPSTSGARGSDAIAEDKKLVLSWDLVLQGPTNAQALRRTFGQLGEPRVKLYRDHASWCPYCQKIWLQLEEKRIPYTVEKINMNCYGDKPRSFLSINPMGLLPAMELDGKVYTDSALIANVLESEFPRPLLPPKGSEQREAAEGLLRLERALFSRWMQWLTSGGSDASNKRMFVEALDVVDEELTRRGGPYFLGDELSLVDITFTPFLERMVASLAYYKGFRMLGMGGWPALERWFAAMDSRGTYAGMKSDFYTHCHDLPPQLGGCAFNQDGPAVAAQIDGTDGKSWHLPLPPLNAMSLEPLTTAETPHKDRLEAAAKMVCNHEAIVRFAARGAGKKGSRPVRAPLADPTATPAEDLLAVDAALRHVVHAMLMGPEVLQLDPNHALVHQTIPPSLAIHTLCDVLRRNQVMADDGADAAVAAASAEYLRDRVGVPRDMAFPAARQLRAHLNWFVDTVRRQ